MSYNLLIGDTYKLNIGDGHRLTIAGSQTSKLSYWDGTSWVVMPNLTFRNINGMDTKPASYWNGSAWIDLY